MPARNIRDAWTALAVADQLARQRQPWAAPDRTARVFTQAPWSQVLLDEQGRFRHEALLCAYYGDLAQPPTAAARIVILPLDKASKPAIQWNREHPPNFAEITQPFSLAYHRLERRWLAQYGERRGVELHPQGAEVLPAPILTSTTERTLNSESWTILFWGQV